MHPRRRTSAQAHKECFRQKAGSTLHGCHLRKRTERTQQAANLFFSNSAPDKVKRRVLPDTCDFTCDNATQGSTNQNVSVPDGTHLAHSLRHIPDALLPGIGNPVGGLECGKSCPRLRKRPMVCTHAGKSVYHVFKLAMRKTCSLSPFKRPPPEQRQITCRLRRPESP